MKMRCVNPAGFPHKCLRVISMHGLGKRRPESPLFNYAVIRGGGGAGGIEEGLGTAERGGYSRFPRTTIPLVISSSGEAPRGNQRGGRH